MVAPHPTHRDYATSYGQAWTSDPVELLDYFAVDGSYTDVAMGATYVGREEISRFHRWMLKFSPDSVIEFSNPAVSGDSVYLEWVWTGSFHGALRLPDQTVVHGSGGRFSVPGVAACRSDADGKLLSHRDYWDVASMLNQLKESEETDGAR